jgi:hypothetical protein
MPRIIQSGAGRPRSLVSKNCSIRIAMSFWFAREAGLCTSLL